jgi:hypothetical protein
MSGAIKSATKVFARVVKPIKKILPIALAAGAIFFTAGSALGLTPTLGEAVGGALGKIGLDGTVGNVLTGAITHAGIGSALGAGGALVSGGDPMKAAQLGTLAGAATGAVTGALSPKGFGTDPLKFLADDTRPDWFGAGGVASVSPTTTQLASTAGQPDALEKAGILPAPPGKGMDASAAMRLSQESGPAARGFGAAPTTEKTGFAKFFDSSAGAGLIAGAGSGLVSAALSGDAGKAQAKLEAERRRAYETNYRGTGSALLKPEQLAYLNDPNQPANATRWKPGMRYRFNPDTNSVELTQVA